MDINQKSITFLLPALSIGPSGGIKVVLEYANYLVEHGFEVHVVYTASLNFKRQSLFHKLKSVLRYPYGFVKGYSTKSWFNLNNKVKEHWVISLNEQHVPKTYFYVATARATSFYLKEYKISSKRKLYLIQGFENWGVSADVVFDSYRLGLKNIVISNWLKEKVKEAGADCVLIRNGFNYDYFKLESPIESRSQYVISMLYHNLERKGCKYGIEALAIVRTRFPKVRAIFFGTPPRPQTLPDWIEYHQCPDRNTHNYIYNTSSIYLAPSLQEGWGLTVGEAMICGNAIVCTDTLGFQEMITDGIEGFIVPTENSKALADALIRIIENPELRIQMAQAATKTISEFSWDKSFKKFEALLNENLADTTNTTTL